MRRRAACNQWSHSPWPSGTSYWCCSEGEGALTNLRHKEGRGTVANVLSRNGIEPAPERGKRTRWSTFLKAHWKMLAACDFLTVEVWTGRGLVTH